MKNRAALYTSLTMVRVNSKAEFTQALKVRQICYTKRGKISANAKPYSAETEMKKPGTLFAIYAQGEIVGSVRMFAPRWNDILESIDGPLGHYPHNLPAKSDSIEISSLCLLNQFRTVETFKLIYSQVHRFLVENNRAWILISADQVLKAKYKFIGFKETGHTYLKPESAFPEISIMSSNQKRFGVYGLHADPIRWNLFLREVTDELIFERKLKPGFAHKFIFPFYRKFHSPSRLVEGAIRRKAIRA